MKINMTKVLYIIVSLFSIFLIIFQIFHFLHKEKASAYDEELLKSCMIEENPSIENNPITTLPEDTILDKRARLSDECIKDLIDEGSKNLLFLGEDDGNSLYDTIGVMSIDSKNKKVSIIMFPRDMYVDYSQPVKDSLKAAGKDGTAGIYKLNAAHYIGAMLKYKGKFKASSISFLADVIEEKFGIDVEDYIKINLSGFRQIVDLYGGVEVYVPYDMDYEDPTQDLYINLQSGKQHLNGTQSEGFVRFRQGFKEDGSKFDVDRKKNQLVFLNEFLKQHGSVSNINKIPDLLKTLSGNILSSIDFGDMLTSYLGIAKDIINDKYDIENKNINGENAMINGVSYVVID